jgi:toxin ParE1/3/4
LTQIVYSSAARADLAVIWGWIADKAGVAGADDFLDGIADRIDQLADHPLSGPRRTDIAETARMLVFDKYLVLYSADEVSIRIVRIVHGSMNLDALNWKESL